MTDQTDFMGLYHDLGIGADCTLDTFRLAYRRRVAELHPDRAGGGREEELKALNLRYEAVLDFHRLHGRLPGAAPEPTTRPPRRASATVAASTEVIGTSPNQSAATLPRSTVLLGLALVLTLIWWLSPEIDAPAPAPSSAASGQLMPSDTTTSQTLQVGMTPSSTIAMLGQPVSWDKDNTLWLYGPSWVRFHCSRVVDWYSSPLQPLKVASSRPLPSDLTRSAGVTERHCPPMRPPRARALPTP